MWGSNGISIIGTQEFNGVEIPVIEGGFGNGKKCITDKTISEIHNQPTREIRRRINDNIKRFKENVDYIDFQRVGVSHTLMELLQSLGYAKQSITQAMNIYLLSERGAETISPYYGYPEWDLYPWFMEDQLL